METRIEIYNQLLFDIDKKIESFSDYDHINISAWLEFKKFIEYKKNLHLGANVIFDTIANMLKPENQK